ncbi:glycosyltransferase family 2 protein [Puniceibacterium sp. HSS470]|nr:glycosyltransferase family 2 protein [Puniceibacterium sp. HSS470]|tara:strand:- start:25959 stop:26966 length:1008 start_codon:yes stop_codon:yes gene_type:complete
MTQPDLAPCVDIIIPTYNRAHMVVTAVRAALEQSWWNRRVTVIDDASNDDTRAALMPFFDRADFNYIRLARNVGTAQAKNAGLLLTDGPAVTFHDSDDIPHRDKLLHQVRVLTRQDIGADACLNWQLIGRQADTRLQVGVALVHHELILPDGQRVAIRRDLSLLDDVFPNLQMGARVPGEWTHINSGLFHADVLRRNGGFDDIIEEDRELRNRLMLNGEIMWVIPELLLTKIETPDSLTQSAASDYDSDRRRADRQRVWAKVGDWRATGTIPPVQIDLPGLALAEVTNPAQLARRDIPATQATHQSITRLLAEFAQRPALVSPPLSAPQKAAVCT